MPAGPSVAELSIGELAGRTGLAVSAIRYYEELGLLPRADRRSGRRVFDETAVRRLQVIGILQRSGFSLEEIRDVLLRPAGSRRERRELVAARLEEIRRQIERLTAVAHALGEALDCGCANLEHCPMVNVPGRAS